MMALMQDLSCNCLHQKPKRHNLHSKPIIFYKMLNQLDENFTRPFLFLSFAL